MALNGYLYWLLEQAAKRAKANGRKTVRPHDSWLDPHTAQVDLAAAPPAGRAEGAFRRPFRGRGASARLARQSDRGAAPGHQRRLVAPSSSA